MTVLIRYRCKNCGKRFETHILEPHEKEDYRRKGIPTGPVHCPRCNRTDLRKGWE